METSESSITVPFAVTPEDLPWQVFNADGTRSATLNGSREPGVTFTYAFFLPAGTWDRPHSHPADARIVVAQGELRLGYGSDVDEGGAARHPVGSYLFVPAGAVHFDGAETDTVVIGVATAPWDTTYVARDRASGRSGCAGGGS